MRISVGISPTSTSSPSRVTALPVSLQAASRSADPVQTAVNKINSALPEGITDWDVDHGDLMDARNALNGLSPQQVSQVIGRLSDTTLRNWNSKMNGLRGFRSNSVMAMTRSNSLSLVTGGVSTAAAALPVGGQIAVGTLSTIGQPIVNAILEDAAKGGKEFALATQNAGMPRNANGELPVDGRRTAFSGAVGELIDANALK